MVHALSASGLVASNYEQLRILDEHALETRAATRWIAGPAGLARASACKMRTIDQRRREIAGGAQTTCKGRLGPGCHFVTDGSVAKDLPLRPPLSVSPKIAESCH